jgi:ribosomal protein S18 acetylase RimI-like enzyme
MQDYPAHLHINLLPRAQGHGAGRRLIHRLLASLAEAGAGGVHWGVDPANTAAMGFYRKLGFAEVREEPGCVWFAGALPIVPAAPVGDP